MALEAGGIAEKLGNDYEKSWVTKQFLNLIQEKILAVQVEPLGDDEIGVDIIIRNLDGTQEYQQCKAGNGNDEVWTLSRLNEAGVLSKASNQIKRTNNSFRIVSPLSFKVLSDISWKAKNTTINIDDFFEHQVTSEEDKKFIVDLAKKLKLDLRDLDGKRDILLFLRKFEVSQFVSDKPQRDFLNDTSNLLFIDRANQVIDFLKNYCSGFNKYRKFITCNELKSDLEAENFTLRSFENDPRILPIVKTLQTNFIDSIEPYLIGQQLIPRPEIDACLQALNTHPIIMIKAEAGMGKSAFLLQVQQKLVDDNILTLPIRLDRNKAENNSKHFGESLGFSGSPVHALRNLTIEDNKAVIILDQLDAIRWTANHSHTALQVCKDIVREVLAYQRAGKKIHLILVSRDFDLNEDIGLKTWLDSIDDKDISQFKLSNLSDDIVEKLIEPYESFKILSLEKQKILTIPLWLSIYLAIANENKQAPVFVNKLELIKKYWEDRIQALNQLGFSQPEINSAVEHLVTTGSHVMQNGIPENLLDSQYSKIYQAMISASILAKQDGKISFFHQALYDYQLGKKLYEYALVSTEQFLYAFGDKSQQLLTRREHIKYALSLILQTEQKRFADVIWSLLTSENIRFHLKYLALKMLKEVTEIKKPTEKLINNILQDATLEKNFIDNCCFGSPILVEFLSNQNYISKWLASGDEKNIDLAIRLLRSVIEARSDLLIQNMNPYFNQSDEWNYRYLNAIWQSPSKDSVEIFEIRKALLRQGYCNQYMSWADFVTAKPIWAIDYIEILIDLFTDFLKDDNFEANKLSQKKYNVWQGSQIDTLEEISLNQPKVVLTRLLPKAIEIINDTDERMAENIWFNQFSYRLSDEKYSLTEGLKKLIFEAGEQLKSNNCELWENLSPFLDHTHIVVEHIIATLMLNLDIDYSDKVIDWLLNNNQTRLACGIDSIEPEWILPSKLIEKFSKHCSDSNFEELENNIIEIGVSRPIDEIKYCLQVRKEYGYFGKSYWGEAQYFLLPALSKSRRSQKTEKLITVLYRRFDDVKADLYFRSGVGLVHTVVSPIEKPNSLSNNAWKKLILAPEEKMQRKFGKKDDDYTESTVYTFSMNLSTATKNEPERFARLALTLPKDIRQEYITQFYYSLRADEKDVQEEYRENWQPCPVNLVYEVIEHFGVNGDKNALPWLIAENIKLLEIPELFEKIKDMALYAKDPEPYRMSMYDPKKGNHTDNATTHELINCSLNSQRSIAYRGIAKYFWEHKDYAMQNKHFIDSAIQDSHPAVQIVAVEMLSPFLNYDLDFALEKYLELCSYDDRFTIAHNSHYFFNNAFESTLCDKYVELVKRMSISPIDEVCKMAGMQIFARWYYNDLFQDTIDNALSADDKIRKGIADVVSQILIRDSGSIKNEKLLKVFGILINDSSKSVRDRLNHTFFNESFWKKEISNELFGLYLNSNYVGENIYYFFHAIENFPDALTDFHESILLFIEKITMRNLTIEDKQELHAYSSHLIAFLQHIYDKAMDDENYDILERCMDVWDSLLKSEIPAIQGANQKFDSGLLN
ncbi:hypothetical protein SKB0120_20750 [Moraxella osloensis]